MMIHQIHIVLFRTGKDSYNTSKMTVEDYGNVTLIRWVLSNDLKVCRVSEDLKHSLMIGFYSILVFTECYAVV